MSSLQDALSQSGIVPIRQVKEAEAQQFLQRDIEIARLAKSLSLQNKGIRILGETTSPDLFRREARKLLLYNAELIQEILSIAYKQGMHQKKDKGGGRLIANLIQVREALKNGPADMDELFPNK